MLQALVKGKFSHCYPLIPNVEQQFNYHQEKKQ